MANRLSLSVTQISNYIKNIFDAEEMLIGVEVYGEITNLKPSSRAVYFDIKDEECALPWVCFDFNMLSSFKFGDKVSVIGKLNYYAKTGKLSFIVSKIEKFGQGDLYKKYIELKEQFEKEGLFDKSAKKEIPKFPKRIGVVTSSTGAVICDIVRVARKKNKSTDIVLYPVKVQGIGAEKEIVEGIAFLDSYNVDAIIDSGSITYAMIMGFCECTNIVTVNFSETLQNIHTTGIVDMGITTLAIPASVTEIQGNAITRLPNLTEVTFLGKNPPDTLGEDFIDLDLCPLLERIVVPADRAEIYKARTEFAPYINLIVEAQ